MSRPCWIFQPKQLYFSFSILFFVFQDKTLWPFLSKQSIGNGSMKSAWPIQNLEAKTVINLVLFFFFFPSQISSLLFLAQWNKKFNQWSTARQLKKYHDSINSDCCSIGLMILDSVWMLYGNSQAMTVSYDYTIFN